MDGLPEVDLLFREIVEEDKEGKERVDLQLHLLEQDQQQLILDQQQQH